MPARFRSFSLLSRVIGLVVGVTLATAALAAASHSTKANNAPRITGTWHTVANPDNVTAIALDGDALWVGTEAGGVARWSRAGELLARHVAPQSGLPCNTVRDIVAWRGHWWFATCRGLVVYDSGRDAMEVVPGVMPGNDLTSLTVDNQDRLWVGAQQHWDPDLVLDGAPEPGGWTGGGLAYSDDGEVWLTPGDPADWPARNVRDLAIWHGAVWVAAESHRVWEPPAPGSGGGTEPGHWAAVGGGVGRFDGAWTIYDLARDTKLTDSATALAISQDALWVGTWGRGLLVHDGTQWERMTDCGSGTRCIGDNYVTALAVSNDGAVFVGTALFNQRGTGLSVLDPGGTPTRTDDDGWRRFDHVDGLPGELVRAIVPDTDASVWLGVATLDPTERVHGRGLTRFLNDRRTFDVFPASAQGQGTVAGNVVTAVERDPVSGALWVGTEGAGLSRQDPGGAWRTFTRESTGGRLGSDSIADIAVANDGTVWVATRQSTYDGSSRRWLDGGLSRYGGDAWTRYTVDDGLPSDHLSALALDDRGKLWIGTGATSFGSKEHRYRGWGLAVMDAATGAWERTYTHPDLTSNNITDIRVRGKEVWVATAYFFYADPRPGGAQLNIGGGLDVFDTATGQWRSYDSDDGLSPALRPRGGYSGPPLLDLRAVLPGANGLAWAGGSAYPDATYDADLSLDGVLNRLEAGSAVEAARFSRAQAVMDLATDSGDNLWVTTASDGLQVKVGDTWIRVGSAPGDLASNRLTSLEVEGARAWVGTDGGGLSELRPVPTAVPTDPAQPTATPGAVVQFDHTVYLPRAFRYRLPRFEAVP